MEFNCRKVKTAVKPRKPNKPSVSKYSAVYTFLETLKVGESAKIDCVDPKKLGQSITIKCRKNNNPLSGWMFRTSYSDGCLHVTRLPNKK